MLGKRVVVELVPGKDEENICNGCLFYGHAHCGYRDGQPLYCGTAEMNLIWAVADMPAPPQACA